MNGLSEQFDLITILGPTASGKTSFACKLAHELNSEILSGDSRQLYKSMDIGTGKDLADYVVDGKQIPYHLIDIVDAGERYNIYEYQRDFHAAYLDIKTRGRMPILCGGSGLYIESVLKGYSLTNVPENKILRLQLESKSLSELKTILCTMKELHNTTDLDTAQRAIRAIEIETYAQAHPLEKKDFPPINSLIIGIDIERDLRRDKITKRLKARLKEGMIDEVSNLLKMGILPEDLIYYGLEYKYVTLFLTKQLTHKEMFDQLEIAIHQFAKRQMTWFRGMEKRGLHIHWMDATMSDDEKILHFKHLVHSGNFDQLK